MAVEGFVDWKGRPVDKRRHGKTRATVFIHFMIVASHFAMVPNFLNLVTYLRGTMHADVASASTMVTNFIGGTSAFALLGAFLSDSYITRFITAISFGPLEFLGVRASISPAAIPVGQESLISQPDDSYKNRRNYGGALKFTRVLCCHVAELRLRTLYLLPKVESLRAKNDRLLDISMQGYGLLALQAHLPSLRPPECDILSVRSDCKRVQGFNAFLLYLGMYTVAMGEGCMRATLAALGGDQFDSDDPAESKLKSSFFNWFAFAISLGSFAGVTLVVWIENNKGWDYGFALSAMAELLGLLVLAIGFPFYRNFRPTGSPLTRMLQVFVAAFKNRRFILPESADHLKQHHSQDEQEAMEELPPTKGLRFLEKAAISHGGAGDCSYCTRTKVEETKAVVRMLPIFVSAIASYVSCPLLLTFTVQQGSTMNTKLGMVHIPPSSLFVIPVTFQMVILVAYDRFVVPLVRRVTGYTSGITHLQRVGIGFLSISLATCVAAVIERKRKMLAEEHGVADSGGVVPMSVLWLGFQFFIIGIMDVSAFVGLLEFFNSEAPRGMKSIGTAIFWCALGLSSLLGTFLVHLVNQVTRRVDGSGRGWLEGNNLNASHLDRFYWLLSAMGIVTFLNFAFWAKRYSYRQDPRVVKI